MIKMNQSKTKLVLVALVGLFIMPFTSCPQNSVAAIRLSVGGGIYTNGVITKVSCGTPGIKMLYTLDGSVEVKPMENPLNQELISLSARVVLLK